MNLIRGIKPVNLAKHVGVRIQTLNLYLDRAEFAHITKKRVKGRKVILTGITESDIEHLQDMIYKRNRMNRELLLY